MIRNKKTNDVRKTRRRICTISITVLAAIKLLLLLTKNVPIADHIILKAPTDFGFFAL
jgi:hypothetical protein